MKESKKTHGINFLDKRAKILVINKTNKNDVIKLIGRPHSISINKEDKWLYVERVISRGKMHKLGQNVLKTNNILELEFDKYGVLKTKKFYDKKNMNKLAYSKDETINNVSQKSFVGKFLQSVRQKMYGKNKF